MVSDTPPTKASSSSAEASPTRARTHIPPLPPIHRSSLLAVLPQPSAQVGSAVAAGDPSTGDGVVMQIRSDPLPTISSTSYAPTLRAAIAAASDELVPLQTPTTLSPTARLTTRPARARISRPSSPLARKPPVGSLDDADDNTIDASTKVTSARQRQNRLSQQVSRQRKQEYIKILESTVKRLSGEQGDEVVPLRYMIQRLMIENDQLRNVINTLRTFIGNVHDVFGDKFSEEEKSDLETLLGSSSGRTVTHSWYNRPDRAPSDLLRELRAQADLPPEGLPESVDRMLFREAAGVSDTPQRSRSASSSVPPSPVKSKNGSKTTLRAALHCPARTDPTTSGTIAASEPLRSSGFSRSSTAPSIDISISATAPAAPELRSATPFGSHVSLEPFSVDLEPAKCTISSTTSHPPTHLSHATFPTTGNDQVLNDNETELLMHFLCTNGQGLSLPTSGVSSPHHSDLPPGYRLERPFSFNPVASHPGSSDPSGRGTGASSLGNTLDPVQNLAEQYGSPEPWFPMMVPSNQREQVPSDEGHYGIPPPMAIQSENLLDTLVPLDAGHSMIQVTISTAQPPSWVQAPASAPAWLDQAKVRPLEITSAQDVHLDRGLHGSRERTERTLGPPFVYEEQLLQRPGSDD